MNRVGFNAVMDKLFDMACVAGIVYLAANGKDGWGWLIFLLIIRHG
jgi:hypothetical protein